MPAGGTDGSASGASSSCRSSLPASSSSPSPAAQVQPHESPLPHSPSFIPSCHCCSQRLQAFHCTASSLQVHVLPLVGLLLLRCTCMLFLARFSLPQTSIFSLSARQPHAAGDAICLFRCRDGYAASWLLNDWHGLLPALVVRHPACSLCFHPPCTGHAQVMQSPSAAGMYAAESVLPSGGGEAAMGVALTYLYAGLGITSEACCHAIVACTAWIVCDHGLPFTSR